MKLGIIGLPQSGKYTVFEALTKSVADPPQKGENRVATLRVPDKRIDALGEMYPSKKRIYAQIEYFLPGAADSKKDRSRDPNIWAAARECDALLHIIRNHSARGFDEKSPYEDFMKLEQELILADLIIVEKRLERIELDRKRGKKMDAEEHALLIQCRRNFENETPLRRQPDLATAHKLRGFSLLSAKPMLVLFNNDDDDDCMAEVNDLIHLENCLVVKGKLEREIIQLSDADAAEFQKEFNIRESAMERVIRKSYEILGLISFFTIGDDEIKAWTIKRKTQAIDAAEVVHSDMKKGFIRAEVLSFDDLMEAGTFATARKKGTVRLEGKTYEVKDGDIINFRFNV